MSSTGRVFALFMLLLLSVMSDNAFSQLNGHNSKGDYGLLSGSQSPPGWYLVAPMFYRYTADEFLDRNGDRLLAVADGSSLLAVADGRSFEADAWLLGGIYVSEFKILGGNYGFVVFPGVTNNALEFPPTGLDTRTSTGLADLYVQPINLGWTTSRADFIAGLGVFAPTGDYEAGGDSNRGLGMWSYELFAGTTLYFDEARTWHFAATAFYETHGKKEGTDVRVGDILTLEGGLGKSFMEGAASVGIAYYAQWKVTEDDFGTDLPDLPDRRLGKHRVYGFGPEVTVPLATKSTLFGFLNLRYFWETGARSSLQGNTFVATLSFPLRSIPLQ